MTQGAWCKIKQLFINGELIMEMKKLSTLGAILLAASAMLNIGDAEAVVIYESLPASNSNNVSSHGVGGPVLADDFTSSVSGMVTSVEWWGSSPLVIGGVDQWEITFHSDIGGTPSTTFPTGVISQHFVSATGFDPDGDGIFHYQTVWNPQDMFVTAGVDYWFSVANASGSTWTWATGLPPTVGSEQYDAVVSTGIGPDGGPHFGPWTGIPDTDFAFRINAVPVPAAVWLFGSGLIGLIGVARRKKA